MFDEQPDGDPHGECAAEIHRLSAINADMLESLQLLVDTFSEGFDLMAGERKAIEFAMAAITKATGGA
jgi:hypothetical protein